MLTPKRQEKSFPSATGNYGSLEIYIRQETENFLKRAGDRNVILIGPSPQTILNDDIATCLLKPALWQKIMGRNDTDNTGACVAMSNRTKNFQRARNINTIFEELANNTSNVHSLSPFEAFCDIDVCIGATERTIYYRDNSHLSVSGAQHFTSTFEDKIDVIFQTREKNIKNEGSSLLSFNDPLLWFSQAKASIKNNSEDGLLHIEFPEDGRITFQQKLAPSYSGPFKLSLKAKLNVVESGENANMRVILQRGCSPVPLQGQSFDYPVEKGELKIDDAMIVLEDAECIMVRIWNRDIPFSANLSQIEVSLSPL